MTGPASWSTSTSHKQGRIPDGGGWRVLGRQAGKRNSSPHRHGRAPRLGYDYLHIAVDDRSRVAYLEVHPDERRDTAAAFMTRAVGWFAEHGVGVERVLTDNGSCYRSHAFRDALAAAGVTHKRTRPYRPQTNGKVCEHLCRRSTARSDSGKGLTEVSFVRCVDRVRCCVMVSTGRTDLT